MHWIWLSGRAQWTGQVGVARLLAIVGIAGAVLLIATFGLAPPLPTSSLLDPSRIVLTEPGDQQLPRLTITAARLVHYAQQFDWGTQSERQYDYSAPLDLPLDQSLGVFVPFIGADARLFVNNVATGSAEPAPYAGPGAGDRMMLARIPANFLKPAFNRIDIVADPDRDRIGLRQIYLADYEQLAAAAERLRVWQIAVARAGLIGATIGLSCSLLCIVLRRRVALHLALIPVALMTLSFGAPSAWTAIAVPAALAGTIIALVSRSRTAERSAGFVDGLLLAAVTSVGAATLLAFGSLLPPVSTWLIGPANLSQLPLLALGLPFLLASDARAIRGELQLARGTAAEQAALARQAEDALQNEIRSHAVAEERQRFVRDMHDGIGGQMQSLLMRLRMRKIAIADVESEVAAGLVDLRLVADSLDHVGNDLASALATFHTRARQQLDAAGIAIAWSQSGDLGQVRLDPRAILSLYRILQEALTNTMRHAQARHVGVTIDLSGSADALLIVFEDDGRGLDPAKPGGGRGLANMAERAKRLSGDLAIAPGANSQGVKISLTIPV